MSPTQSAGAHKRQSTLFIVCGLMGAMIEFCIIYLFVDRLHISPYITYIPSAAIPAIVVFLFNKHITFASRAGNSKKEASRFLMVYSSTFILNYCLSSGFFALGTLFVRNFLSSWTWLLVPSHIALLGKAGAIGICAFINYALSHMFIFPVDQRVSPIPL